MENQKQPQQTEQKDYQQYLGANPKGKTKRILLITGIVLAFILITGAAYALLSQNGGNNNGVDQQQSPADSNSANVPKAVCEDENCFREHFARCQPATYDAAKPGAETHYEILSPDGDFCRFSSKFIDNVNQEYVGKDLTCKIDQTQDFETAEEDVLSNPGDYDCEGSLVPVLNAQNQNEQEQ